MESKQYRSQRFLKLRSSLSLNCTEHPFCEQQIAETIKSFRPPPQPDKLIVTELALDDWVAQTFGIELGLIPQARPPHLPQDVYDMLRKYFIKFQATKKPISPRSRDLLFPQLQSFVQNFSEVDKARIFKPVARQSNLIMKKSKHIQIDPLNLVPLTYAHNKVVQNFLTSPTQIKVFKEPEKKKRKLFEKQEQQLPIATRNQIQRLVISEGNRLTRHEIQNSVLNFQNTTTVIQIPNQKVRRSVTPKQIPHQKQKRCKSQQLFFCESYPQQGVVQKIANQVMITKVQESNRNSKRCCSQVRVTSPVQLQPSEQLAVDSLLKARKKNVDSMLSQLEKMIRIEDLDASKAVNLEFVHRQLQMMDMQSGHKFMMELHTALDNDLSLTQAQRSQQQSKLLKAVGWFQKGIKIRGSTESALDCFKQAYVVYDTHIPSIFNMAISYDLIGKYKCAIKYFQIVIDIKPSMDQAYFGACLSNLKIADYNQALMYIDQAIVIIESHIVEDRKARNIVWFSEPIDARSTSKTYEATLVDALYLKSLLLRLMKRYEEATKTYKQVRKFCAYEEKKGLIETAFGMMLIGLSDRRKAMDWTDKMLYYIKFYSDRYSTIKDPILPFYNKNEREWTNPKRAIELLLRKPFFKRFTAEQLQPYVSKLAIEQFDADTLIFVDYRVCVILCGSVEIRKNIDGKRISTIVAKYQAGDILGFSELDDGYSKQIDTWITTISLTEVAWIDRADMQSLWMLQHMSPTMVRIRMLQTQPLFSKLCQQSLMTLGFELCQIKEYQIGQVIMRQSDRSQLHPKHQSQVQAGLQQLQNSMTLMRDNLETQGKDSRHYSVFRMMMTAVIKLVLSEISKEAMLKQNLSKFQRMRKLVSQRATVEMHPLLKGSDYREPSSGSSASVFSQKFNDLLKMQGIENANEFKHNQRGVYIIEAGRCLVRTDKEYDVIQRGDCFGESQVFQMPSWDYFGDIVAQDQVTCIFIPIADFNRLGIFEINRMRPEQEKRMQPVVSVACNRLKLAESEIWVY